MWFLIGFIIYYLIGIFIVYKLCEKSSKQVKNYDDYEPEYLMVWVLGPVIWPILLYIYRNLFF